MSTQAEAADQVVKIMLEGSEHAIKIAGAGAKQIAALLYAILRDQKLTKDKVRLANMLRSNKELRIFPVRQKAPKLTPPDAGKNYRFDTLGEDYTLERIWERIYENTRRTPAFAELRPMQGILIQKRTYKMTRKPAKKLTGLRALYFKYCVLLGTVKNHPERIQRPSYLLREDVLKLDRYIAIAKLLIDNKIVTVADLQAYGEGLQASIAQLTAERQDLRNALKRAERAENEPAMRDCTAQIMRVSASLRKVRKEVKLCDEIEASSTQVSKKLWQSREAPNGKTPQHDISSSDCRTNAPR